MGTEVVVLARFLLTGVALLLAFLAYVSWSRRKDVPEAATFAVLALSMAVYSFGYAGELAQTAVPAARFWLHIEYLALPWAGALWVMAACKHNGIKSRPLLLFLIPVITFVGHYTNVHNLFYTAPMTMVHRPPFWVLTVQRGPLSLLDNAYLMVAFCIGAWIYLSGLKHASSLVRRQSVVMVIGSFLPFVGYFTYLGGLSPWGLDITPVTLGVTCLVMYYGIFHCGIFNVSPLARNIIFNSMRDAVLVMDTYDRLLDFNHAALAMFPVLNQRNLGTPLLPMLNSAPLLAGAIIRGDDKAEIQIEYATVEHYLVRIWPLFSSSNPDSRQMGRAVVLANVTAQVQLREELRSRAETDALTGIANRRRFNQVLHIECTRFTRGHAPFSLLMIDLDYFKEVNDRYGHAAGDEVLRQVAQILLATLRSTDLVARYGGEEFAVLLTETRIQGAMVIAERIRAAVEERVISADGNEISLTLSIGVTSHTEEDAEAVEELLKRADEALYRAKAAGRNCVDAG
ncbi:diguanylate cyclase [Acidicapsa dinghuensis]|uniref:diguanylate cyclase n=1 Tax=Acidicapsa dinghuensis TaxID=2218256 RepID=A0ABW1EJS0_9BACT|nr:diguanylate cyclase [Acidicapsa dinghuensis]